MSIDKIKLDQNATVVDLCKSSVVLNLCWIKYFWKPASVNISAKLMTMTAVTNMPNASGVRSRANTIVEIGDISFAAISVILDHFVAVMTLLFKSDM